MIARMHAVGANAFRINMSHTSKDDLAERVAAIRDVESRSGRPIRISAMTEKDRCDLEAAVGTGVDWIALSFVQRSEDIAEVREAMQGRALVMAKIEKPQAVARLEEIIHASDALMVARGDLGVEMPLEKMPSIQKLIIRSARRRGKPVVVATQMLESMIASPVPTRAEVSNVATAVFEDSRDDRSRGHRRVDGLRSHWTSHCPRAPTYPAHCLDPECRRCPAPSVGLGCPLHRHRRCQ